MRFFCQPSEIREIMRMPGQREIHLTELWTIKESLVKYDRTGLTIDPLKISVKMGSPVRASVSGLDCSRLYFTQFTLDHYALTVCSQYSVFFETIRWITL